MAKPSEDVHRAFASIVECIDSAESLDEMREDLLLIAKELKFEEDFLEVIELTEAPEDEDEE